MAINLRNNVTGTGLNLVTNPILKSSATNPVNIGVKTPVNQYKSEDPRYSKTTPVVQNTQYMSVNPKYANTQTTTPVQTQTQVQTPVNNNQSRFIGFQAPTLQDSLNILQQRQQTSKKKENLTIPTLQNTNTKNANTYIQQMKVVQDFEADVYKNQGKMTKEQIAKLYPEFSNKLDKAMDFQKNLRPIVKNGEYVDETQIRKYFPEFLENPNLQPKKELEKQAKSIDDENKKIFNKAKNVNKDLLSYNGKVFANFMSELSNLPNQVRKQYNINSDATDSDIITYLYNNDKNFKQEFDRIQNLELTDQDKARLGVGGNWLNRFNVGVSNAVNAANEWYQKNVSQPLSDVPLVGAVAQTAGTALAGADKTLTNLGKLTNGEVNNVSDIAGAGIKTLGGGIETAFGTAYLPATLGFNVVGQSEAGQEVLENTVGLVPNGVTAVFQNTPLLKDFYNSLDEEAQADLSNEIAIALLQGVGAGAKKTGLDIKAGVAADAIANALQRGKYAAKFQIFVEKGLANDKTGKFQEGALGRIFKEGGKEFEQAMKDNFSRFNEVVEARKQARDFKKAPVDNNNLEDKRTPVEKVKSEIKNTAEAVKEKVKQVNETVKEKYANLNQRRSGNQEQQGQQGFSTTSKTNNGLNQSNFSQKNEQINTKKLNTAQTQLIQNYNRMNPKAIDTFEEKFGENYGQYMYERGFTKAGEDNLKDMVNYQKDLMDIKENALNQIEGRFKDQAITDMLDHLLEYYENTKNRKMLAEFSPLKEQLERDGLTMAEANKIRKKYQYDIRTKFYSDGNSEKIELANNIYLAMKDFLDKTAKENGLDSLDEINREIMKVQHIIGGVSYKLRGSSANNTLGLTDYITLASMLNNPAGLAVFLGKQALKTNGVRNFILEKAVGGKGNTKNRITADKIEGEIERIAKINDEKVRNKELEKFYNTYIKPVKELSEYFDNSVAEFKKQFNEMVEEGTLDNALPDLRESDVKSGKKNLVTSKNQVTIEADEKGNARRKGQISEVDKRSEDNKKGGYDNKPTKPTEPKKPAPTQPKNSVTSKKEEKTNTSEEHEQKTEKTAHNVIQDPLNVEKGKQLPSNPESKNGKPVVIDSKGKVMEFYHGTPNGGFEKFEMDKRGTTNDISSFGDYGRGIYFTPNLETAKGYAKHGGEAKNPEIYKVKLYMNNPLRFDIYSEILKESYKIPGNPIGNKNWTNELKKILDKYGVTEEQYEEWSDLGSSLDDNWYDIDVRDYGYDGVVSLDGKEWIVTDENQIEIIGKDGKEKILNEVTKKKPEKKTEVEAKEEPKKENSDLKAIVGDDYYNWLEEQLEIINDSRKGNKGPLKLEDLDIGSDIYLAEFEKLHREKLKSLQQELSDLNINQADTKLTPKQQKMLEQAKSEEERQGLLEKWRREYLEKNQMSDEDIAKVENIMNKAHELVEQREKYYNYILDWTKKNQEKPKNLVTTKRENTIKKEVVDNYLERLQQDDLFRMPETEDIEAIDNELTARQQEDLKNMPETEDIEVIDKEIEKNKVTAKYNQEDTTIGQITKHLKDKEKGMKVYKDSEGRIIGQSLVDFNYSAFNIKDKGNTSRVMIQREDNGENIYWMIDPYITEKGIKEVNTLLKNIGVDNYHLDLRENPVKYAEFKNNVVVVNEKTGNVKELSKKYSYDFQGKTNLHNTEITLRRNAEEQAQFEKEMAEKKAQREKEKAEYEERQRQKEEEKKRLQAEEDKKREPIKSYLEENYKTPLQRGKVKDNLTKKITWNDDNGKFRVGMTFQWLDELAEKDGEFGEVMVTNTKSQPVYKYDNKGYRLNKTEADYLRYKIDNKSESKPESTPENTVTTEEENHLFKKEAQVEKPKNLVTNPPKEESKIDKILKESEGQELKVIKGQNNNLVLFKLNGEDRAYSLTDEQLKELNEKKGNKVEEKVEEKSAEPTQEKPKNLVTEKTKQESNTKTVKIQDVDKDTYYNDIMKNPKDHPREMFIYKDGNYYYPSYILPSGKILTPENTYWGEVSSEEAARNWLQKKAEEHSVENETKKTERLKNMVGKTAEKYEETLKRIESDNPMQEIRTSGDYFKYGTSNSQMAKAKKEADANAEVGTFKKDVIDGKEGYRIFVSGSKQDAIRAFYEPKTGKAYRIYRGPTISDAKPFTTREVDRIEKFLGNVEKQLEKETKKEKVEKKDVITQEWLDSIKPDKDGVIELEQKSNEIYALRQGKESLIKGGKADGKYLQNYGGEKYPQYLAVYIKDGNVYEGRRGLEDQYMKTKQEAVDWLNQKEKDVEHEATAWYNERDYEPLPKTISVESEAEKAGPKRIAPDRVKWQQETYDKGLNNVKDILKASPLKLYELGFKSDRSKAVQDIMSERKRIRELPEEIAEKQWNELAKSVYEPLVIKDISKGYRYPEDVTSKFPKAQMQKAIDARARYEKGLFTSFSNKDTRANNQYRDEIGAGIKSQDGKPVTQEQMNEIVDGIRSFGGVFGLDMKKFAEDNNIIYVHLHGGNPFLMGGGGKSRGGGMNIAGLYRRGSDGNISISLGGVELVMEKGEDGEMKKNNVNATPEHELAHAFDYMLDNKLFSSQDIEILKKTMNKPTRLINYYNKSQEIVARAVEQYAAKKTGKSRYGRPYKDSQAYWNEENFEKYVKPIVEKNMKEKLKEYQLDNSKKNVISNGKNNVTSK